MKTLTILLMLLAGQMFEQDDSAWIDYPSDTTIADTTFFEDGGILISFDPPINSGKSWTIVGRNQAKTVNKIDCTNLILEYAENCYNDSVPECYCETTSTYMIPKGLCWTVMDREVLDSIVSLGIVYDIEQSSYYFSYPCGEDTTENIEYGTIRFKSKIAYYTRKTPTLEGLIEWLKERK